jgi:hypothetical protein
MEVLYQQSLNSKFGNFYAESNVSITGSIVAVTVLSLVLLAPLLSALYVTKRFAVLGAQRQRFGSLTQDLNLSS